MSADVATTDITKDDLVLEIVNQAGCDVDSLKTYLKTTGLDINLQNSNGLSAVAVATTHGQLPELRALITAGASVNKVISDCNRKTPVMIAAENGNVDCLEALVDAGGKVESSVDILPLLLTTTLECQIALLKAGVDVNQYSTLGIPLVAQVHNRAFALAAINAGCDISMTDDNGVTPLMFSCRLGNIHAVEALIQAGADVNAAADSGTTTLMKACGFAYNHVTTKTDCIKILLKAGAELEARNLLGKTALMFAACSQREFLEILLLAGSRPNVQDYGGKTALMYAAQNSASANCQLLIDHHANVNVTDYSGRTALMYLEGKQGLSKPLMYLDVPSDDPRMTYWRRDPAECCKLLLDHNAKLNVQDKLGKSALIYAAQRGMDTVCQVLIDHKVNVNTTDNEGRAALMHVGHEIYTPCPFLTVSGEYDENYLNTVRINTSLKRFVRSCEILLSHKANVNVQDMYGKTALTYVNDFFCLEVLLSNGADTDILDKSKNTALDNSLQEILEYSSQNVPETIDHLINKACVLLDRGAEPLLNRAHRESLNKIQSQSEYLSFSKNDWNTFVQLKDLNCFQLKHTIEKGYSHLTRLLVCNGMVSPWPGGQHRENSYRSALGCALYYARGDMVRYFIANCYLTHADIQDIRIFCSSTKDTERSLAKKLQEETVLWLEKAFCEPWPLVKLAFIAVSSALGSSPDRENRIAQTQLPPRLQRMLMFQEPISRVSVRDWSKIPLCFDPVEYEKLPKPRPFLQFWPYGRELLLGERCLRKFDTM